MGLKKLKVKIIKKRGKKSVSRGKIEKKKKKKENSAELQIPNVEAEIYNNNKNCD